MYSFISGIIMFSSTSSAKIQMSISGAELYPNPILNLRAWGIMVSILDISFIVREEPRIYTIIPIRSFLLTKTCSRHILDNTTNASTLCALT